MESHWSNAQVLNLDPAYFLQLNQFPCWVNNFIIHLKIMEEIKLKLTVYWISETIIFHNKLKHFLIIFYSNYDILYIYFI